jgi:NAD(P)-dependent dehydrogenase (short-subunit alcohol dehydrogenase family)
MVVLARHEQHKRVTAAVVVTGCSVGRYRWSLSFVFFVVLLGGPQPLVVAGLSPHTVRRRLALVTGGTRGIGRGIVERLLETGEYAAIVATYNSNEARALAFLEQMHEKQQQQQKQESHNSNTNAATTTSAVATCQIHLVRGDLSLERTRDKIFEQVDRLCSDNNSYQLSTVVHNAGQYVGITSDSTALLGEIKNLQPTNKELVLGNGSLLGDGGKLEVETMRYYQRLYGEAYMDVCERSLARMSVYAGLGNDSAFRGCLIGISSPGCNALGRPNPGYSMPGTGKCVMEHTMRLYALAAAKWNVNANVIVPGVTRTEAWERMAEYRGMSDKLSIMNRVAESVPMKDSVVDPRDIGDVVVFLSQPGSGGRFITGQTIPVDGGLSLR